MTKYAVIASFAKAKRGNPQKIERVISQSFFYALNPCHSEPCESKAKNPQKHGKQTAKNAPPLRK